MELQLKSQYKVKSLGRLAGIYPLGKEGEEEIPLH